MSDLIAACARAWARFRGPPPIEAALPFAAAYDQVFANLHEHELTFDDRPFDQAAFEASLLDVGRRTERFLGYYSPSGLEMAFERYGFFELLRQRGFVPLLQVDLSDRDDHRLTLRDEATGQVLVELEVGIREVAAPHLKSQAWRLLFVNWLLMQDPRAEFGPQRRPLPGQAHPGLGLFLRFAYLLRLVALRMGLDGLLNHPAHPHNGVLYGKFCYFVDPVIEGRFRALERDIGTEDLAWLTRTVDQGGVLEASAEAVRGSERPESEQSGAVSRTGRPSRAGIRLAGKPFVWQPAPQMLPVSRGAKAYFRSSRYRSAVRTAKGAPLTLVERPLRGDPPIQT